jgi:hypothetical protein
MDMISCSFPGESVKPKVVCFHFQTKKYPIMKESSFLLITLVVLIIVIFIAAVWDAMTKENSSESELHARDRYAVAEKIDKELKDKHRKRISRKRTKKKEFVF